MKNDKSGFLGGLAALMRRPETVTDPKETAPTEGNEATTRPSSHKQVGPIRADKELVDIVQIGQEHPCHRCPAPCCRLVIHDHAQPHNFMAVDYIRFALIHGRAELHISRTDGFAFAYWSSCKNLEESTCHCKVHQLPEQPRTCVYYNPYNCFYKRNFVGTEIVDVVRLNLARFEVWAKELSFNSDGELVFVPTFERTAELVKDIPLDIVLEFSPKSKVFPSLAVVPG